MRNAYEPAAYGCPGSNLKVYGASCSDATPQMLSFCSTNPCRAFNEPCLSTSGDLRFFLKGYDARDVLSDSRPSDPAVEPPEPDVATHRARLMIMYRGLPCHPTQKVQVI